MNEDQIYKLTALLGKPSLQEKAFYAKRRVLRLGSGIDENGKLVRLKGPIFVDFEASSLSEDSWPIEVGLARVEGKRVVVKSKLIRPRAEWPEDDWSDDSEAVHGITRPELDKAETADDIAAWLMREADDGLLVSNAPAFDQQWLDRLLGKPGPAIADFNDVLRLAFASDGCVAPGRLHRAYKNMSSRPTEHRAGPDAAHLAFAWRAGVGK